MTITTPPRPGAVYWTAFTHLEGDSGPVDPLRFDMYVERLGNVLLPGITSRVERLRYFGMVCAGLEATRPPGFGDLADRDVIRRWRRRFLDFEAGWALANVVAVNGAIKDRPPLVLRARLTDAFQGLRGANRVLDYWRRAHARDRIRPHDYVLLKAQEAQGGLGAYLVALRTYGFIQPDRFDLTAAGLDLARAFRQGTRHAAQHLLANEPQPLSALRRIGEVLLLPRPTREEAVLVRDALFRGGGHVASVFDRLPAPMRRGAPPEKALARLARADGGPLERAAAYALALEPFRVATLHVFTELGLNLGAHGATRLADLPGEGLTGYAEEARAAAGSLARLPAPQGLEPVGVFAERVAGATGPNETVRAVVAFHAGEGRRWIVAAGAERYALGAPGAFTWPDERFLGYTLPAAMRVYRDIDEVAV